MEKRVFLIHGWKGSPEGNWFPWLKAKLQNLGFRVSAPYMPNPDRPKMKTWLDHLSEIVGKPDENCYFVGHSLGCITILRYLEELRYGEKVGGAVLVAGFAERLKVDELQNFFLTPIDWDKINSHCRNFVAINSNNDRYVPLSFTDTFKEKLGAKIIIKHNMGHFSDRDGVTELPVALDSILELSKN